MASQAPRPAPQASVTAMSAAMSSPERGASAEASQQAREPFKHYDWASATSDTDETEVCPMFL